MTSKEPRDNVLQFKLPVTVVAEGKRTPGFMTWETPVPNNWFMMDAREDQVQAQ